MRCGRKKSECEYCEKDYEHHKQWKNQQKIPEMERNTQSIKKLSTSYTHFVENLMLIKWIKSEVWVVCGYLSIPSTLCTAVSSSIKIFALSRNFMKICLTSPIFFFIMVVIFYEKIFRYL